MSALYHLATEKKIVYQNNFQYFPRFLEVRPLFSLLKFCCSSAVLISRLRVSLKV